MWLTTKAMGGPTHLPAMKIKQGGDLAEQVNECNWKMQVIMMLWGEQPGEEQSESKAKQNNTEREA